MKGGKGLFQVTGAVYTQSVVAQSDLDKASHSVAALVQVACFNEPNDSLVPESNQSELKKAIEQIFNSLAAVRNFMDNATVDGQTPLEYTPMPVPYPKDVQP